MADTVPACSVRVAGRTLEATQLPGARDRAAIVLLHEGLGSVGLWRQFPAALARATGRRVIAFSRFGHGHSELSPWDPDRLGFHHREARVVLPEVLAAFDAPQPLLIGHSDGASIALIYAGLNPVSGVVAIAPHVFVEPVTLAGIRETRRRYQDGELRERLARHHDHVDAAFFGWCDMWLDPDFAAWNIEPDCDSITAPTLLIQGTEDPYGTPEQLARIRRAVRWPAQTLEPRAGHSPHLERPREVVGSLARFATSVP